MTVRQRVARYLRDKMSYTLRLSDDRSLYYIEQEAHPHGFWMGSDKLYLEVADALQKYSGSIFSRQGMQFQPLEQERRYRCHACGTEWTRWPDLTWRLAPGFDSAGRCCDNEPMCGATEYDVLPHLVQLSGPPLFRPYFRDVLPFTFWKVPARLGEREAVRGHDERVRDYLDCADQKRRA